VGHSDGGSVALLAAIRHPAAIRSVCAVSTHVYADAQTIAALRSLGPVHEWDGRTRDHYARQHGDDWPEVVASWVEMWTTGSLAAWDIRDELSAIRCPVLVVHDRADPLSSIVHADAIVASVTAAQLSWHDSRSHRPHLTDRERFRSDLQSFWATVSTAR
jgi:pimeloyl-ACP methyl ester carboxylesterase